MKIHNYAIFAFLSLIFFTSSCNNDVFIDRPDVKVGKDVLPSTGGKTYVKVNHDIERCNIEITQRDKNGNNYLLGFFAGSADNRLYFNDSLLDISAEQVEKGKYLVDLKHNYYPDTICIDIQLLSEFMQENVSLLIEPRGDITLGEIEFYDTNSWLTETDFKTVFALSYLNGTDEHRTYTYKGKDYPVKAYFSFRDDKLMQLYHSDDLPMVPFHIYDMFYDIIFKGEIELSNKAQELAGYYLPWTSDLDKKIEVEPFEDIFIRQRVEIERRGYDYVMPVYNSENEKILQLAGRLWLEIPMEFQVEVERD